MVVYDASGLYCGRLGCDDSYYADRQLIYDTEPVSSAENRENNNRSRNFSPTRYALLRACIKYFYIPI